jgi:two-component sensor histidine kinase
MSEAFANSPSPELGHNDNGLSADEILLREANHRIANQLATLNGLVNLQKADLRRRPRALSPAEAIVLLEDVQRGIDAMARLHRLLADGPAGPNVDLAAFLPGVAEAILSSLSFAGRASLTCLHPLTCPAPREMALPISLIVSELVTNAVKHAHPTGVHGQIEVSFRRHGDDALSVAVSDDGIGLPENIDPRRVGSRLGLDLIHAFADQLHARLSFVQPGIGLSVQLEVPLGPVN